MAKPSESEFIRAFAHNLSTRKADTRNGDVAMWLEVVQHCAYALADTIEEFEDEDEEE